jgi:hypothetical protein
VPLSGAFNPSILRSGVSWALQRRNGDSGEDNRGDKPVDNREEEGMTN